ncbi:hypothetical protein GGS21DRAFT_493467 [Xylaria nigripes]|nr:hypothetical protein GGS21DRAFT_493467 [Xylaria nigripes]
MRAVPELRRQGHASASQGTPVDQPVQEMTNTQRPTTSARLAQSVERETLNLKVAGSTPASGSIPDAAPDNWE